MTPGQGIQRIYLLADGGSSDTTTSAIFFRCRRLGTHTDNFVFLMSSFQIVSVRRDDVVDPSKFFKLTQSVDTNDTRDIALVRTATGRLTVLDVICCCPLLSCEPPDSSRRSIPSILDSTFAMQWAVNISNQLEHIWEWETVGKDPMIGRMSKIILKATVFLSDEQIGDIPLEGALVSIVDPPLSTPAWLIRRAQYPGGEGLNSEIDVTQLNDATFPIFSSHIDHFDMENTDLIYRSKRSRLQTTVKNTRLFYSLESLRPDPASLIQTVRLSCSTGSLDDEIPLLLERR